MTLRIFKHNRRSEKTEGGIGAPRAEVISRLWQAIAFLAELQHDVPGSVRQSTRRTCGQEALKEASRQLIVAAEQLAPAEA